MGHVERTANGLAVIDAQCQTLLLPVDRLTGCLITMRDSCADETDPRKEAQLVDLEFHETRSPINPRRLALIGRRRQVAPRSVQAAKRRIHIELEHRVGHRPVRDILDPNPDAIAGAEGTRGVTVLVFTCDGSDLDFARAWHFGDDLRVLRRPAGSSDFLIDADDLSSGAARDNLAMVQEKHPTAQALD